MAMYGSANYDYRFAPPGYDERFHADYRTSFNYAHVQTVQAPGVTAADSPPSEVRIFSRWVIETERFVLRKLTCWCEQGRSAMQSCLRVVLRCVVPVAAVAFLVVAFRSIHPVNENLPHHHVPQNNSNHTGNHSHHPPPVSPLPLPTLPTLQTLPALKADDEDLSRNLIDSGQIRTRRKQLSRGSDTGSCCTQLIEVAGSELSHLKGCRILSICDCPATAGLFGERYWHN